MSQALADRDRVLHLWIDDHDHSAVSLALPSSVAIGPQGIVYIGSIAGGAILEVENGTIGPTPTFFYDNPPSQSNSIPASSLALDTAGNLYVAEWASGRVLKVAAGGITTTLAGGGTDPNGDGGPATNAALREPNGVAVDSLGNVYIAEYLGNRIRKVSNGVITTIAGTLSYGFSGDRGPAANALLDSPYGIAVDQSFNVYFSDEGNLRIRELIPSGTPCTPATVSPTTSSIPMSGGTLNVTISKTNCPWAVGNLPSWVSYFGGAVETGTSVILATTSGVAR